jgi:dolichol-phosphate mannosyltransferase
MKTLLLVPTYNEIENIPRLLPELMKVPNVDVLVIDDNSPDGTQDAVKKKSRLR